MIDPEGLRWLSATESRSSISSPGKSSCCCSWHPIGNPLCFSAHSGSNLLPEPGVILDAGRVILDAGSLVAMVVKEVAVISAPLFGGLMAIVQLVSVTAGVTQKRYVPYAVAKRNTNVNYPCWHFEMYSYLPKQVSS